MPKPPHKNITGLDFQAVERQIGELQLVEKDAAQYEDEASKRHLAFLNGAIAALTWVAGGSAGSELYSAQLEGEKLARVARLQEMSELQLFLSQQKKG